MLPTSHGRSRDSGGIAVGKWITGVEAVPAAAMRMTPAAPGRAEDGQGDHDPEAAQPHKDFSSNPGRNITATTHESYVPAWGVSRIATIMPDTVVWVGVAQVSERQGVGAGKAPDRSRVTAQEVCKMVGSRCKNDIDRERFPQNPYCPRMGFLVKMERERGLRTRRSGGRRGPHPVTRPGLPGHHSAGGVTAPVLLPATQVRRRCD